MSIHHAGLSDIGRLRTENQDQWYADSKQNVYVVADGMGGHASGEVASKMSADVVREFFDRSKDEEATWPYKIDRDIRADVNRMTTSVMTMSPSPSAVTAGSAVTRMTSTGGPPWR